VIVTIKVMIDFNMLKVILYKVQTKHISIYYHHLTCNKLSGNNFISSTSIKAHLTCKQSNSIPFIIKLKISENLINFT